MLVGAVGMLLANPLFAARARLAHDTNRHLNETSKLFVHNLDLLEALYFAVKGVDFLHKN